MGEGTRQAEASGDGMSESWGQRAQQREYIKSVTL